MYFGTLGQMVSRSLRFLGLFSLLCCWLAVTPARAAGYLYAAGPYNVFVQNNFTQINSDTIGAVAAGGTITVTGGFSLASGNPTGLTYSVIAGTQFQASPGASGTVTGNLYAGSLAGMTPSDTITGTTTTLATTAVPIDFANQFSQLSALSTSLAGYADTGGSGNGCANSFGNIVCTANGTGLNVINIPYSTTQSGNGGTVTSADLTRNLTFNIGGGATAVVINVAGVGAFSLGGAGGWTVNGDSQKLLFNFSKATSITLASNTAFFTSLLAPGAAVTGGGGQFDGSFIASSFSGSTEFHALLFNGTLPQPGGSAPEPATLAMFAGGAVVLAVARRKR